jgi:dTMP kinase
MHRTEIGPCNRASHPYADLSKGFLVCFEGIDGSGKSTVALSVKRQLCEMGIPALLVDRSIGVDCPAFARDRLVTIAQLLWHYSADVPVRKLGDRHLIHLLVSWFHLFDRWVLRPHLERPQVVLVDAWAYKYVARFALKHDFDAAVVESWFEGLSRPDLILLLLITPAKAWLRKLAARSTEADVAEGELVEPGQRFLEYQERVQRTLSTYATRHGWEHVDAGPPIQDVSAVSARAILNALATTATR